MVAPQTKRFSSLNGLALQPSGGSCRISLRSVMRRSLAAEGEDCDILPSLLRFRLVVQAAEDARFVWGVTRVLGDEGGWNTKRKRM